MHQATQIDAILRHSSFATKGEFEDECDRRLEGGARRQIVLVLVALLALTALGLAADSHAGILAQALKLKCGLLIPSLLLGIYAIRRLRVRRDRIWLVGAMPFAVSVAVVTMLGVQIQPPMTDRYATVAGLAMIAANVALPMKFRQALALWALDASIFVGIPLLVDPFAQVASYLDILLFMSAIALATTVLVHNRENSQMHALLLTMTNERQTLELQALVNELTQIAHRDPLTGTGNRRSFDMRFHAAWEAAASRNEHVALILIDVDHFKLFNDAAGHAAGDSCLKAVAGAIARGANCPIEAVGRYGGEEFAIVLQSKTGSTSEAIRTSVAALAMPHPGLPDRSFVTVSVGKAFAYPGSGIDTREDLVKAADEALYEAKRAGRNRVVVKSDLIAEAA